ncbi:MAG: glycoside hydrolase/phage tail family protein [Pseudomonadota bacterium]
MATLLLAAAGSAIGGAVGGSVLGFTAAGIGQAVGAIAGGLLDQRLLGAGASTVETGRARSLRLQTSTPGASMSRVYGRMRVSGQLIWSTRYLETVRESTQGGKASAPSATVREYSYSISIAVALCQGRIERVGRIWADGKQLDTTDLTYRVYPGDDTQLPDPKIEAVEGAGTVPAYRGTAYVVFEDLPVEQFGNRVPQLSFEVFRSVERGQTGPEAGTPLPALIKGVALSPGTGEYALDPTEAAYVYPGEVRQNANIHNPAQKPDIQVALDDLEADLPAARNVSLVVSWFGSDLRCGHCRVEPKAEAADRSGSPEPWSVAGLDATTAPLVSRDADDRPVFGGTPSDASVIRAIQEMNARGMAVMLYPFLLMDITEGNGLPDPYGRAEQPPFPWRGRITTALAPDQPGSTDQSAAAAAEVASFFGTARASDFQISGGTVTYSGPAEWTWRRFALHMAALGAAAGGVDAICIGTELRELTRIRSAKTTYPSVTQLIDLAAEIRLLLPNAKISYAADWSEYWGHQPSDGSGDRIFHLDPLWADSTIDFVGIDDYLPLSDWRHEDGHLDASQAVAPHSLPYLEAGVEGGEHYDWYYASDTARAAQTRTPIDDTAHGEHWIYRPKDIRNWWLNPHHNRIDGVRQASPTAWVPGSKPVWLTETGCPAVDLGANMPNLFYDPKSSESGLPPGSAGARDDEMQRRYIQAKLGYWANPANNPTGAAGEMIPADRVYVWTWDARPFPDFPMRGSVWSDGEAHQLGHWITGRVGNGGLADVVHEICLDAGLSSEDIDVSRLHDSVHGLLIEETGPARAALQPLMLAYGLDAHESGGKIVFTMRGQSGATPLEATRLVAADDRLGDVVRERAAPGETAETVRVQYIEAESDYRVAADEARTPDAVPDRVSSHSLPLAFPTSKIQRICDRWLSEGIRARDRISLTLPPHDFALDPADLVRLDGPEGPEEYRIERVTDAVSRTVEAVRVEPLAYLPAAADERRVETPLTPPPGPISAVVMDLPRADGGAEDHWPHVAATADPWPGAAAVYRSADGTDFNLVTQLRTPAFMGTLLSPLAPADAAIWQRASVEVRLPTGSLLSRERLAVLNGANGLALETLPGQWEIVQAQTAELIGTNHLRLSRLLRGRRGTEDLAALEAPIGARIVVLDQGVTRIPLDIDARGLARHYRIGPATKPIGDASYVALEDASAGIGLRPYAPAHLRAAAQGGDIAITWIRRTRIGGDAWEAEVPLGEETEAYRVRILAGTTQLRKIETIQPSATYTAAQQAADGAAGTLTLRVAQRSAIYGYGPEKGISYDV